MYEPSSSAHSSSSSRQRWVVPGTWYWYQVVETATQPGVKTSELHDDKMKTGTGTGMGSILLPAPLFLNKL